MLQESFSNNFQKITHFASITIEFQSSFRKTMRCARCWSFSNYFSKSYVLCEMWRICKVVFNAARDIKVSNELSISYALCQKFWFFKNIFRKTGPCDRCFQKSMRCARSLINDYFWILQKSVVNIVLYFCLCQFGLPHSLFLSFIQTLRKTQKYFPQSFSFNTCQNMFFSKTLMKFRVLAIIFKCVLKFQSFRGRHTKNL